VRGYNALQIGLTIIVTGVVTMMMSPLSTLIARRLDLRLMLAIGLGPPCCMDQPGGRSDRGASRSYAMRT
jgi:hypothetical protein